MKKNLDVSVQNIFQQVDHSGQFSFEQSEKGVQKMMFLNDQSIQKTIEQTSWNGQNTIDVRDISIQK